MSAATTAPPPRNTVRLLADGPLELRGELRLRGEPIGSEAWLCRCGRSQNKPHCDGSHRSAGRPLPGDCAPRGEAAAAAGEGPLEIEPRPNGPNRITGPFALLNAKGEVIERLTQGVFCRCGESKKAPYCDGSHRAIGFVAP
ncbi:CDGSH iron-sulfur domain-containing protein [Caldovatus aquaticus]|uniref:CDGSH iron-sulfur domain-containing protein n=1 Tax=Caldovatus aquaticus TaxID=2865671 RepID=A0ABS7F645_9PROT|nr:CDGSH iron-sulfur domain-containing protein [Caldovatus aquaticus]MBW8271096.1 CDGSH iron-sulfur domain-containing protein [Caldovatus aquaticus]